MLLLLEILVLLLRIGYYYLEALFHVFVPPKVKDVRGKVALVTGGGRGIGRAVAEGLAKRGAKVVIWDIDESVCGEVEEYIRGLGGTCRAYKCDISDARQVSETAAKVRQDLGEVYMMVNNAAYGLGRRLLDYSEAEIRRTMDVNVTSLYWTAKEFLPHMMATNSGHMVLMCSVGGRLTSKLALAYCTSKHGSDGFYESLEDDLTYLKATGINITTIYPLSADTKMLRDQLPQIVFRARFDRTMSADEVGSAAVDGILRNQRYVYIPPQSFAVNILRIIPSKAKIALKAFAATGFHEVSDDKQQ